MHSCDRFTNQIDLPFFAASQNSWTYGILAIFTKLPLKTNPVSFMNLPKLILLLTSLALLSCGEEPPLTLSWEERTLVDSLYKAEVVHLRPVMDSICDTRYDSLVNFYKDSLWVDRIEEIKEQLERIQLQ